MTSNGHNDSNNLITYSDPSKNHGDFTSSDYKELFRLLVDKKYGIDEVEEEEHDPRQSRC